MPFPAPDIEPETPPTAVTRPAHWGFWGTVLWGLAIAIAFTVVQLIVYGIGVYADFGERGDLDAALDSAVVSGTLLALGTIASALVCSALIVGVIKLKKQTVLRDYLSLHRVSRETLVTWLAILLAYLVLTDGLTRLLDRDVVDEFMRDAYRTAEPAWPLWVAVIIAAPLFEELFFRGFLFKGLQASWLGALGTIVATSALWTLTHLQYDAFELSVLFVFGILVGVARARTGSLYIPLAAHAVNNLVATVQTAIVAT